MLLMTSMKWEAEPGQNRRFDSQDTQRALLRDACRLNSGLIDVNVTRH